MRFYIWALGIWFFLWALEAKSEEASLPERFEPEILIPHPGSAEGLLEIRKDGSYIYQTMEVDRSSSVSFRFGNMAEPRIRSGDGSLSYREIYNSGSLGTFFVHYDHELFDGVGALSFQGGFGFFAAQGRGRFRSNPDEQALESYSLYGFPLEALANYRFQLWNRQALSPYLVGGGQYLALLEVRDDGNEIKPAGVAQLIFGGGLLFSLNSLSRDQARTLGAEFGISNIWLNLEFREMISTKENLDFSGQVFLAGVTFDF